MQRKRRSTISSADGWRVAGTAPSKVDVLEPRFLCSATGNAEAAPEPLAPVAASIAHTQAHRKSTVAQTVLLPAIQANVPQLHSDPTAQARIFLDFTGSAATRWNNQTVPATPAYDSDGKPGTFSDIELANIREIWNRVAEKFSPFNLDVTTVDPGVYLSGQTLRMVIGGDGAWTGGTYGGYSIPGGFQSDTPTCWIFPVNLNAGDSRYVGEAAAHEAGHNFGLEHQSLFAGSTKLGEYNTGTTQEAPIMGRSYYATRGVWWVGQDSTGAIQDDMAVIAGDANGFGYRPEDHGQTVGTADPLTNAAGILSGSGVISTTRDTDFFSFTTSASSTVTFTAKVAPFGGMLHLKLALLESSGAVIRSADSDSLGQNVFAELPAGSYRIEVASHGNYGDVGQYTISGVIANLGARTHGPTSVASDGSGLTARAIASHVRLSWSAEWARGNLVEVERSTDSGANWSVVTQVRATHFIDPATLRSGAGPYSYRVIAPSTDDGQPSEPVLFAPSTGSPHRRQAKVKSAKTPPQGR